MIGIAKRSWFHWLVGCALLGATAWTFEAGQEPSPQGLQGIWPSEMPAVFSVEKFDALGPNWKSWSEKTWNHLQAFYQLAGDVEQQRAQLQTLKNRLATMERAMNSPQYRVIHHALAELAGPLARRIELAEATLDILTQDPHQSRQERIHQLSEQTEQALRALEADLQNFSGGSAWLNYLQAQALRTGLRAESHDAQIQAVQTTLSLLQRRNGLENQSQREFLSRPSFLELEKQLTGLLELLQAPTPPLPLQPLRDQLQRLIHAVEEYEQTSSQVAAAEAREAWREIRKLSPDGGERLMGVLANHFFNYNVRIVAAEEFLSRLVSEARTEQGQVQDFVLGANVGGWQITTSQLSIDLKPSADRVRFDLVLSGVVQSNTAGSTSEATIYSYGYHTFTARKEVQFDGQRFTLQPASINVVASTTPTGAVTNYSGGLFGGIAERIALREAEANRPASEAHARMRVTERILPRFNKEAEESFAKSQQRLEREWLSGLKEAGIYPDSYRYQSTHNALRVNARLMKEQELGGSKIPSWMLPEDRGATLAMHETVINNVIDEMGFAGKTMSEEELRQQIERFLSKALAREFKLRAEELVQPPSEEEAEEDRTPAKVVFAEYDPLRIQLRDGQMILIIRAGLSREGKEPIPTQQIVAPLRLQVQGDKILITREGLEIIGVERNLNPVERKVMNSRLSAALPDRTVSGKVTFEGPKNKVEAVVREVHISDGWISLRVS
ncbi:MAG: hypothetical protein KatS3mg114_0107 [Planctomycetaceae bacterium]|nr:MAG: hypothetical protein KatS3mg114_0107 [Planctomycetaceae bacterium]